MFTIRTSKKNIFYGTPSSYLVTIIASLLLIIIAPTSVPVVFAATMSGTNGDDALLGTDSADSIDGKLGGDIIFGYDGNDRLYGGRGNDVISGGGGDDNIFGWRGGNILLGGLGDDTIYATGTNDIPDEPINYIFGEDGDDHIVRMGGPSIIHGGSGNDNITSGADDTVMPATVYGESGNDKIYMYNDDEAFGGIGDDYLWGTRNADLNGDWGDDILVAHAPDIMSLTGGPGADQFDCQGWDDVILPDFNPEEGDTLTDCPSLTQ